ncbi:hypothetical protein GCM10027066_22630 [Dyella jejuensis]
MAWLALAYVDAPAWSQTAAAGANPVTLGGDSNDSINAGLLYGPAIKTGNSIWTLTGTGNTGVDWTIEQGELVGNTATFTGNLTFSNNGQGTSPTLDFYQSANGSFNGAIAGSGELIKDGTGTLALSGDLSAFSGALVISNGGVALVNDGNLQGTEVSGNRMQFDISNVSAATAVIAGITGAGNVLLGTRTLVIDNADDWFSGTISGSGGLTLNGGRQTLAGNDDYSGTTLINNGTLALKGDSELSDSRIQIDGGSLDSTGKSANSMLDIQSLGGLGGSLCISSAGVVITQANDTYSGVVMGDGPVLIAGGREVLDGINTYTGPTTVAAGATLIIGDSTHATASISSDVSVNGGTLGGSGTIQGSAILSNNATLAPGDVGHVGTLTVAGNLTINDGSQLDFDFGSPGSNFHTPGQSDHVVVNGNLSIGDATLNITHLGSMGPGLYNLFDWAGSLSLNDSDFALPTGMTLQVLTSDRQINLIDTQGMTLNEWDANVQAAPGVMGGGSGTWSASSATWSDLEGRYVSAMAPQPGFAIFGGAPGKVTVDDSHGTVGVTGMQFVSDGYHLAGDAIALISGDGTAPVIRVSSGATTIIDNVLEGSSGLDKTDGGTLVLTGTNTYQGATTLSGGYLSVSSDANLGQGSNALDFEGGTLQITGTGFLQTSRNIVWGSTGGGFDIADAGNTFTVAQSLTGSGGLLKSGAGALMLAGSNSYSGGTIVSGGTLLGNAASLQGNITNNAKVVFAQQTDGIYAGVMSGDGALVKTGSGTLTLDAANTYSGGTTVSTGTLEIGDSDHASSASIEGAVDVQSGGVLRGHGTVVGDVSNDGIVWPGGSAGPFTIQGNYTQNADGALQIDVTPRQASTLIVSGKASLAGTLNLVFAPGTYGTTMFPLVQAGTLSGTFATVNGTIPTSVTSQVSYTGTEAQLVLTDPPANATVSPLDGSLYGNLMRSVNVAGAQDLASVLDVSLPQHAPCGADHAPSMQNVSSSTCGSGVWAQYTGSNLSLDGADGLNSSAFGLLGGADYGFDDTMHAGVQAGVGQIDGNDKSGGNGRAGNVHGGLYGYADAGPAVLSAVVDYMHSDYHFNRASGIGAATAATQGNMLSGALQAAWPLQLAQWQLAPKIGALYQRQVMNGFSETLASDNPAAPDFPVNGSRSRYITLQPYAAFGFVRSFMAQGVTYVPQFSVGYRYDTRHAAMPVVQVTAQDGTVFALPGAAQNRGMATASARITAKAGATWNLYMDYQGLFAGRLHDNALSLGFAKRF